MGYTPLFHHGNTIGESQRFTLIMRDIDDSQAQPLLNELEFGLHMLAQAFVERTQRLIHQHDRRTKHLRPRQRDTLLLPTGQLRRITASKCLQLDDGKGVFHAFAAFVAANATHFERKGNILRDCHMRKQSIVLEDHRNVALFGRQMRNINATQHDRTGIALQDARNDIEHRGFARSAWPKQGQEFT